jgi:hypothetical protein
VEWKGVYRRTHQEALFLVEDDGPQIEQILREYNEAAGLDGNGRLSMDEFRKGVGANLDWPPGRRCPRDAFMVKWWAGQKGIDLEQMDELRACFFDQHRNSFYGPEDERFLALCVCVRFRVEFADNSQSFLLSTPHRRPLAETERIELNKQAWRAEGGKASGYPENFKTEAIRIFKRAHCGNKSETAKWTLKELGKKIRNGESVIGDRKLPSERTIINWWESSKNERGN